MEWINVLKDDDRSLEHIEDTPQFVTRVADIFICDSIKLADNDVAA